MTLQVSHNLSRMANAGNLHIASSEAAAAVHEVGAKPQSRGQAGRNAVVASRGPQLMTFLQRCALLALAALLAMAVGAGAQWAPQAVDTAVTMSVTVTASPSAIAGGPVTVNAVDVVSNGAGPGAEVVPAAATGSEFVAGTGTSTCASASLSSTTPTCTESVTFTPAYPGLRRGAVVLLDSGKHVIGTAYLSGVGIGGLDVLSPGNLIQIAGVYKQGTGSSGPVNGVQATKADLLQPSGVVLDGAGNMYIADSADDEVRMVCAGKNSATIASVTGCSAAGIIVDIAGGGAPASSPLSLDSPSGIAIDGAGNLYIADTNHHVIYKLTAANGAIAIVAGVGTAGYRPADDGGLATAAELNFPQGVTADANGNLFIADTENQRIRRVDAATGIITTVAGGGTGTGTLATQVALNGPYPVAFDLAGNMYIPDSGNNIIRKVTAVNGAITSASTIQTVAGTGAQSVDCNITATNPTPLTIALNLPTGVAVDPAGNLYISDTRDSCIRKTNVASGTIINLAVSGSQTVNVANGLSTAEVYSPEGIFIDGFGNIYFADYYNMVIEEVQSNKALFFFSTPVLENGESALAQSQIVENDGNDPSSQSSLTAVTAGANTALNPATTTCAPIPYLLSEDANCVVSGFYAPTVTGTPMGFIDVSGNTVNDENAAAPLEIVLEGTSTLFNIDLTDNITANPPASAFGNPITFTVTVTEATGTPSGTVALTDSLNGGTPTPLATLPLADGTATFKTSTLPVGIHVVTATYGTNNTQPTVSFTVYEGTSIALTSVPQSPSLLGTPVVFTAAITGPNLGGQTLSGTVTFTDNASTFTNNAVPVTASVDSGTASFTAAALPQGLNTITAKFIPSNSTLVGASSATLNQDVKGSAALTVQSSPNPSTYGNAVAFTVAVPTVGATGATGNVSIQIVPVAGGAATATLTVPLSGNPASGSVNISTLPVGSYNATATYNGDTNYTSSTATLATPQVVSQVQTTTALAAKPNPGLAGAPIAITATVTPNTGTVAPTGAVTFTATLGGVNVPLTNAANVPLTSGAATINPSLAPGTYTITATYSGNTDDAAGTPATLQLVVNAVTTTTTVTAKPSPAVVGATITFTATVATNPAGGTPTGAVTFTAAGPNGNVALGSANLVAGVASVTSSTLPGGTYTITASYAGNTDNAASSGTTTDTVGLIPTTTDLSTATVSSTDVLVAVVQNNGVVGPTPTGTVTFSKGTTSIGSATLDADGVATLTPSLPTGNYTIVATYGGDTVHSPSTSGSISITGSASNFTLTVTPSTVSIPTNQNANLSVTLTSISGFADTIGLGCGSLPAGVNCHFSSISVPLAANGKATAQVTIDTNNPLGGGATAMNRQAGSQPVVLAALFLPFSLLMGFMVWRFRKRHAGMFTMILVLVLSGAALVATGCSGFTQHTAAPGTYTFQVVGVGTQSNASQYQAVTLTITQ